MLARLAGLIAATALVCASASARASAPDGAVAPEPSPTEAQGDAAKGEEPPRRGRRSAPRVVDKRQYKSIFDPASGGRRRVYRQHRFLPVMMVLSDPAYGAIVGIRLRYVNRPAGASLNRIQLDLGMRLSTRLIHDHDLRLQLRDLLGREELVVVRATVDGDPTFPYFGVADRQDRRGEDLRADRYAARVSTFAGSLSYAEPFWRLPEAAALPPGLLRWFVGAYFAVDRIDARPESLLAQERPQDLGLHRRGHVIGGVQWDRRDNEYQPTTGALHDASLTLAGPWMGSSLTWARFNASLRWYRPLFTPTLVIAQMFAIDALIGKPPLIPMGQIGGLEPQEALGSRFMGRGIYRLRMIGDTKAVLLTELRYQPFEVPLLRWTLGLGVRGFVDLGKVFQRNEPLHAGIQASRGGGFFLVWDRFFVLRVDAGFSREGHGVYVAGEHPF
ncbi:MAG: BamA/TamA family outer membrane protein [Nannocystis sp.]|nr:BamA/TamA family outer membrane protein [Nannocystis sp.]